MVATKIDKLHRFFIQRRKPDSILVSTVVDVSVIGFLWILVLGGVAAESSVADVFDRCDRFTTCDLGKAVLGLGWLFFFMLLGLFCWMLIYTFMHYGSSWSVWRTPFALLVERGAPVASGRDVENKPGVPASTDHQQQAHHTAQPASTTYPPANDPVMGQAPLQMSQTQPTSTQAQT
ncbi:hypothetical protein BD324DRAFT_585277 [Kockovaella imperatae]|uniref:Uncharacterized protein n=1 Tax=Kockovaella imperatae TaxID=4999 RepID=A0A1Y1U5G8_9TREE|nr:hypothetical protein BD324DRAFT_585277 [Kockovaella imperatae]ORX33268.1 hypothetical protein BD324DRAFT_585277 [Kockovaella imperatae]